ncbi:hypothetical protein ILYODFUR_021862 [Ilyodon furcidens]|uniref:Uncharacterized protein n=1 Tax=Ilyodon furcidens TaxID=33524 RepID=A0ABV0TMI8_9TELE
MLSAKNVWVHSVTSELFQKQVNYYDLLESEEERAGPDDEEQGQVEDPFLSGHHHPSIAAEGVLAGELLPFSHLSRYHHRRHGGSFFQYLHLIKLEQTDRASDVRSKTGRLLGY